jgi:cytochrome c
MKKMSLALLASGCLMLAGPAIAADAAAGEAISQDCADCHGDDGMGDDDFPGIAGLPEAEFIQAMKEYQDGTRTDKMMSKQVKGLSEEDIANLAAYFATLK